MQKLALQVYLCKDRLQLTQALRNFGSQQVLTPTVQKQHQATPATANTSLASICINFVARPSICAMALAKRLISDVLGRGGIASSVLDGEADLDCVSPISIRLLA